MANTNYVPTQELLDSVGKQVRTRQCQGVVGWVALARGLLPSAGPVVAPGRVALPLGTLLPPHGRSPQHCPWSPRGASRLLHQPHAPAWHPPQGEVSSYCVMAAMRLLNLEQGLPHAALKSRASDKEWAAWE